MKLRINKILLWYFILIKRLLKKISFLVILLLIPLLTVLMTLSAEEDSGLLRVALAARSPDDEISQKLIDELNTESKLVRYTLCDTEREAINSVIRGDTEVAWVLEDGLEEKIRANANGEDIPLVNVYACEDSTLIKASRELLFSKLYNYVAFDVFKSYVDQLETEASLSADELHETFYVVEDANSLIEFDFKDSATTDFEDSSYLTTPLRGLLAVIMLLCGMAASLYFRNDEANKTFSNLHTAKRGIVFLGNNLAALSISGVFVSVALAFSGTYTGFWYESLTMMLFILMTTGFCTLLGTLFDTPNKFALLIPVLLILSIAFTPVILNTNTYPVLQAILPPYLYLNSTYDASYIPWMAVYALIAIVLAYLVYVYKYRFGEKTK